MVEVQGPLRGRVNHWETVLGHIPITMYLVLASTGCKQIKEQWGKILARRQKAEPTDRVFLSSEELKAESLEIKGRELWLQLTEMYLEKRCQSNQSRL